MTAVQGQGEHTRSEIYSQPEVWERTLKELVSAPPGELPEPASFDQVLFVGCGSTHYLSQWAARLCQQISGVPAEAPPASELLLHPSAWIRPQARSLLVAVSRSAETTETVLAMETFQRLAHGEVLAVTCNPEGPVAANARWVLSAAHAQEISVAQTRSFTSMMLLIAWLIAGDRGREAAQALPAAGAELLAQSAAAAQALGRDLTLDKFFFLGSGALYGLASEGMLKMKEMSLSHSEAYHFMEIRHGPMSIVDERAVILGLMGTEGQEHEEQVIGDMQRLRARTVALSPDGAGAAAGRVDLGADALPPLWRAPLYLPFLQLVAFHRAMAKGLNPDRPQHLEAVVKLYG